MTTNSQFAARFQGLRADKLADIEADHDVAAGSSPSTGDVQAPDSLWNHLPLSAFPLDTARRRGWITASRNDIRRDPQSALEQFVSRHQISTAGPALMRQPAHELSEKAQKQSAATLMWLARVTGSAPTYVARSDYKVGTCSLQFMRDLARLSVDADGPQRCLHGLARSGINVTIEPHLPYTRIDGAITLDMGGHPIIALTLRYDRIDHFWFTIMHELAHLYLHVDKGRMSFVDDLDEPPTSELEREANRIAAEALIPRAIWYRSDARRAPTRASIRRLAKELERHPAIIAGRLQHDLDRYDIFREIADSRGVRESLDQLGQ